MLGIRFLGHSTIPANLPGNSKENLPGNSKENLPGNSKENLPGNSKENLPGSSKRSLACGQERPLGQLVLGLYGLGLLLLAVGTKSSVGGVPPPQKPFEVMQPDGTKLTVMAVGPQRDNGLVRPPRLLHRGYAIIKRRDRYEYAVAGPQGGLRPTGLLVGQFQPTPDILEVHIRPTAEFLKRREALRTAGKTPPPPKGLRLGKPVAVKQPDGSTAELTFAGTGSYEWYSDRQNFTVVRVPGRYVYAVISKDKRLVPTDLTVGQFPPADSGLERDPSSR